MTRSLSVLVLLAAALASAPAGRAQDGARDVTGVWFAAEDYFRAGILFERDPAGVLRAYFTSDGASRGAPLSSVEVSGDRVVLQAAEVGARFVGTLAADGSSITGVYTQEGASVPLTFVPAAPAGEAPAARPQHPAPPYPYVSEDIVFASDAPGVQLAGTLTVPDGPGPHPGVVLVPGTGDNDRDYQVYGHRPFLVLADHLTRRGVAVLRYDERGAGESGGDPYRMSFADEALDVAAAVRALRSRPEIDLSRVGIVGHSVGGVHAPLVHESLEPVAFVVLLMAPSMPLRPLLQAQGARMAAANGAPPDAVEAERALGAVVVGAAAADTDSLTAAAAMAAAYDAAGYPEDFRDAAVRANTSLAYRGLARSDPGPALERLDVPVLAVYGRADLAVTAAENAGPMAAALAASRSPDAAVLVLERVNHYLQTSETGREDEAAATNVTVAPSVLEAVAAWVLQRVGAAERP